ncbi:hypothetical protein [Ferruginibacter sp. HRS2-29]|uniref:hypothetical protein n=1 Tax=Ferruginibacter sp. HRS2-29 TaxID=2487334 RepID=UPI0020CF8446|nr:hypothetical protein [Ferruginibacter sp. HRS2-29]MCP9751252.1 hypothetical protein [Ferruginibacter sp. HRS2-29]
MKRRFDAALEFVNTADVQLRGILDEKGEMYIMLSYKRRKAIEMMAAIVAQNPARLMVKIEVLKQEKIILENAINHGKVNWLDNDIGHLTGE